MRLSLLLVAACGLTLLGSSPGPAAEPSGLDGTWIEVEYRPSREEHPALLPPPAPATLSIDGHLFIEKEGDRGVRQSLLKLVPGRAPEAADLMTVVDGQFRLTRTVYKVEGDTLTIKEGSLDRPRPTDLVPRRFDVLNADDTALCRVFKRRAR